MSLIIATGSNIGDSLNFLNKAKNKLSENFDLIAVSDIFISKAVDYNDQPNFYNQVLEFKIPTQHSPKQVMQLILNIEQKLGRERIIDKGPRTIDIDIIFWANESINESNLTVPHPRWNERSFVVRPLQQLPFFQTLKKWFKMPTKFEIEAKPIKPSKG